MIKKINEEIKKYIITLILQYHMAIITKEFYNGNSIKF